MAISSRSAERIEAAAAEIGATGLVHDSGDLDATPRLVAAAQEALGGGLDVVVTNTGGPPGGADPLGFGRDAWEAAYRTLVLGPLELVQAVIPGMRERGWGRVVSVGSTSVREPIANLMLSNTHRAGLVAAFKTIARAVAADGVTLNTRAPRPDRHGAPVLHARRARGRRRRRAPGGPGRARRHAGRDGGRRGLPLLGARVATSPARRCASTAGSPARSEAGGVASTAPPPWCSG